MVLSLKKYVPVSLKRAIKSLLGMQKPQAKAAPKGAAAGGAPKKGSGGGGKRR